MPPKLILASTSKYRAELLSRLRIGFDTVSPGVDESALPQEAPVDLVQRLAQAKCLAVAKQFPDAVVIGSDQIAIRDGQIVGKPHDHARAFAQLKAASGKTLHFLTAVCVRYQDWQDQWLDRTICQFRTLDAATIERYLAIEKPYDCAGSFKSEGLGISLFDRIQSDDPTALIGLPLIRLCHSLRACQLMLA